MLRSKRRTLALVASVAACLGAAAAIAQTDGAGSARSSASNLLNPSVSVVGWFQAEAGDRVREGEAPVFDFREAEIGLQADVDPYSRADFFVAVSPDEGVEVEEATLTFLALPGGISAKAGKFRSALTSFNRIHPPETPFADRPLAAARFLGEEGLAGVGVSVSGIVPNPLGLYTSLDVEITSTPNDEEARSFTAGSAKELLYTLRASGYVDLSESGNLSFGAGLADGPYEEAGTDSGFVIVDGRRSRLYALDAVFRWKNPRRAIYRSLTVRLEWMERRRVPDLAGPREIDRGLFGAIDYQFARRWHVGVRHDRFDSGAGSGGGDTGVLGYLTFRPSEFSSLSLQARRLELESDPVEASYVLKTTFSIGPHGAHPF